MIQDALAVVNSVDGIGALILPRDAAGFWAALNVLATVGLGIVAYRGLGGLVLARKDIVTRSRRESVQAAIDRSNEMARALLPPYIRFLDGLAEKNVPLFVRKPAEVSFSVDEEQRKIASAISWTNGLDDRLRREAIRLMNDLEVWSMSFTNRLADEKVAFGPCSTVFCQMVMSLYPSFLTQRRANPASGPYQNVVSLFEVWYAKMAKDQMLEHLQRLQTRNTKLPEPLGTDLDG